MQGDAHTLEGALQQAQIAGASASHGLRKLTAAQAFSRINQLFNGRLHAPLFTPGPVCQQRHPHNRQQLGRCGNRIG